MRRLGAVVIAVMAFAAVAIGSPALAAGVTSITPLASKFTGGNTMTAMIRINAAAPSSGQVVTLSSNKTSVATVPSSITIPAGATSKTVTISSKVVTSNQSVTITATAGGVSKTAVLTIIPTALAGVDLLPASVAGGISVKATVKLTGPAPTSGVTVTLTRSNSVATVPSSVKVAAGAKTVSFTITTKVVTSTTTSTISAAYGGVTKSSTLTVKPTALYSLTLSPTTVVSGNGVTGTVKLTGPTPTGGVVVSLSSNSSLAKVPASVTIPAGSSSATFAVTTGYVSVSTPVTITSSYSGVTKTAKLNLGPVGISSVMSSPITVLGGNTVSVKVTLTGKAPTGGSVVTLSSSNSSAAAVPSTVTVPAGALIATVPVTTGKVTASSSVTVTASLGGVTKTGSFTVKPILVASLSVLPGSIAGGASATGTITLNGAAGPGGVTIALTSSSAAAKVPATVTVPAGQTKVTFAVVGGAPIVSTSATITATLSGASKSAVVTVTPPPGQLSELVLNPSAAVGGQTATLGIRLASPAPAGGIVVNLTSSNQTLIPLPATYTIPAGEDAADLPVSVPAGAPASTVHVTVGSGAVTLQADWPIQSSAVLSVTVPDSAAGVGKHAGGQTLVGRVYLVSPAPAGGLTVQLTSSNPATATVPATMTVPEGASDATFPFSTAIVSADSPVTITASYQASTASTSLTVVPFGLLGWGSWNTSSVGGVIQTGVVTINGAGLPGGTVVSLTSSNRSVASVPATVTVAEGATSANVPIQILPVTASTSVTLTATLGSTSFNKTVTAVPSSLQTVSSSSTKAVDGDTLTGTVKLTGWAPAGGAIVSLTSANPAIAVPASVTVPANTSTATFAITANTVTLPTPVIISATYLGVTKSAAVTVYPIGPTGFTSATVSAASGSTKSLTLVLNGPAPAGGLNVAITSNPAGLVTPSSVTVPAGQSSLTFSATFGSVAQVTTVSVVASANAMFGNITALLQPVSVTSLTLDQPSVKGGASVIATVTLSAPAPAAGLTLAVSSSDSSATVPAVTLAAGATSTTFTVTTTPVGSAKAAQIRAGLTPTSGPIATLTIQPPHPTSVTLDQTSVTGGTTVVATVAIDGPAPAGGQTLAVNSDNAAATVPATVTVPEGATSITFNVTTTTVAADTTVHVTVSDSSVVISVTLTVNP